MKNKLLILVLLSWISGGLFAQTGLTGTYSTSFGEIKIVQENDIIYGDYGTKGTLLGTVETNTIGNTKTVKGTFYNNDNKGSFEWLFSEDRYYKRKFTGKYGWGTSLSGGAWNGEDKNRTTPTDLKKALWSGKWNTTYGEIFLKQDGNQVTGTYRNVGTIHATVINGGVLEGTFTNNGKKGTFSFKLKDDSFEGLWGWGSAVGKEKWTGTKAVKSGVAAVYTKPSSNLPATSAAPAAARNYAGKYRVTLIGVMVESLTSRPSFTNAGRDVINIVDKASTGNELDIYGSAGIRMRGKGRSGEVEIKAIGNKAPRLWNVSSTSPQRIKFIGEYEKIHGELYDFPFCHVGHIDRIIEYNIQGELANENLTLNLQLDLTEELGLQPDFKHGWSQHNVKIKDIELGKVYYYTNRAITEDYYVGLIYKVEKF